jgi:hypothetical protein
MFTYLKKFMFLYCERHLQAGKPFSIPAEEIIFSSPQRPKRLWGIPILVSKCTGGGGTFLGVKATGAWLNLVLKLKKIRVAFTPPYIFMSWCLSTKPTTFLPSPWPSTKRGCTLMSQTGEVTIIIQTHVKFTDKVCSKTELSFETINPFRHFGRNLWIGDRPVARPLPTRGSTTQKNADIPHESNGIRNHSPCVRKFQDHTHLRLHRNCDRF